MNNVVRPTMNKLSTMLFQVVTVEQCCNNMLTILFIVGRTTLFTPVDINLQQVVDFLNFYACISTPGAANRNPEGVSSNNLCLPLEFVSHHENNE